MLNLCEYLFSKYIGAGALKESLTSNCKIASILSGFYKFVLKASMRIKRLLLMNIFNRNDEIVAWGI